MFSKCHSECISIAPICIYISSVCHFPLSFLYAKKYIKKTTENAAATRQTAVLKAFVCRIVEPGSQCVSILSWQNMTGLTGLVLHTHTSGNVAEK